MNDEYFKTTYGDKLEEIIRVEKLVLQDHFGGKPFNEVRDSQLANAIITAGFNLNEAENSLRVTIATANCCKS